MTAKFALLSSMCVSTMVSNVPVVVGGVPYGKCRLRLVSVDNLSLMLSTEPTVRSRSYVCCLFW